MYLLEPALNDLKKLGIKIGNNTLISRRAYIDHLGAVEIGDDCVIGVQVMILSHDAASKMFGGESKLGKVVIGNKVFIGINSIILKDVKIGDNVIVGAGSVVTRDIPTGEVWAGNPAKFIKTLDEYLEQFNITGA